MEKKCIIVSYAGGLNGDLDKQIMMTAKKCRLEHDGTGYERYSYFGFSGHHVAPFDSSPPPLSTTVLNLANSLCREMAR